MTLQLTKQQAIEAGYTHFGYAEREWQCMRDLCDLDDDDYTDDLRLFEKSGITPSIKSESIKEMIADQMESDWGNDTGDDTEEVFKAVNSVDFSQLAKDINDAVARIKCYRLTNIKLIKG